jgi:hypothetical protein
MDAGWSPEPFEVVGLRDDKDARNAVQDIDGQLQHKSISGIEHQSVLNSDIYDYDGKQQKLIHKLVPSP